MLQIQAKENKCIDLGRRGEDSARVILFDISGWAELYGQGKAQLIAKRDHDLDSYPVEITQDNTTVSWVVKPVDNDQPGYGNCELVYITDGSVVKSIIYQTHTEVSLSDPVSPPDSPDIYGSIKRDVGNLDDLKTKSKDSLVSALNEVLGNSGKVEVDSTLSKKGQAADASAVGEANKKLDTEVKSVKKSTNDLRNELSYDSEKWGVVTNPVVSENLITSPDVTWLYGYLVASNGSTPNNTDTNWRKTADYFPVSPGDTLEIKGSITGHNSVAMFALYDKDKVFIQSDSKALVRGDFIYTVPKDSNVAYAKFSLGNKLSSDSDESRFYTQELYITNGVPISTPKENIDNLYNKIEQANDSLSRVKNPLEGKIVFLAGDSRSSTDYDFYKTTLEAKCGCIALVQGASGRNVAYNASDEYFNRLTANPHDFSIWIVGGNDTGASGTIGTFSADSVNGKNGEEVVTETNISVNYSGTKFIQAIDHMMRKYKSLFYDFKKLDNFYIPKMIFCTDLPQQRNSATAAWSMKENWERKRNAIIECCEKNNVACLDLYKLCNFDMSFEPYWVSPTDKVNDNGLYFMDGLHPNKFGIDIITSLEIEEMKKYIIINKYEKVRKLVQSGLVMYCDGIDNTGNGHNATATTWVDLTGNGNNLINVGSATATTPASSVLGEWTADGMHIVTKSNQLLRTVNNFDMGADRTLEMRVTLNVNDNMAIGFKGADRIKFRADGVAFWVRISSSDVDTVDIRPGTATVYNTPISVSVSRAYNSEADTTTYRVYVNGNLKTTQNVSGNYRSGESAGLLFGMEMDDLTMHSVRIYNRALTDDEVSENYKYDVVHFKAQ